MILSKFSVRERILTLATIGITLIVLSYVFIIEPLINAYSRLNRHIRTNNTKLVKGYSLLKRADNIKDEYIKYRNQVNDIPSDEEEVAFILKVIESIATKNDIHITNIRPQPPRDRGSYQELVFELTAESGIDRLMKFIYDTQTSNNLLRVKRLTLSSSTRGKAALKSIMEITRPSLPQVSR